jgi:antirestriction protein ArdC
MNKQNMSARIPNKIRAHKKDIYRTITEQIVKSIEAGAGTFQMPWHRDLGNTMPTNALTGATYNGVNVIALWAAAELSGFAAGYWATYKQWAGLGAQVRKGEKGSVIVFYKQSDLDESDAEVGETETKSVRFARSSHVFNVAQVDGWQAPKPSTQGTAQILREVEKFVAATAAEIRIGGDHAYYRPVSDHIQIPDRDRFTGTDTISATESFYATLLHELSHNAAPRIMPIWFLTTVNCSKSYVF